MITDIPKACLSLYFHLFLIFSHNNIDYIETLHLDEGVLNVVRELVYGSETGKYAGGSLATVRVRHVRKALNEVPE
jgi:hypothetical protein